MESSLSRAFETRIAAAITSFSLPATGIAKSEPTLVEFIETSFIPHHIERKSRAGRIHYHSMLKHILRRETIDRLFPPDTGISKARLKRVSTWPYLDDVRLCDLNALHVRQLISSAQAQGYSPQTVRHIRNVLNAIICLARKEHVLSGDNPVSLVELPPMVRKKSYDLTIHQAKSLLHLMRYPEREITLVAITTGMSVGEICALRWKHVNLSQYAVHCHGRLIPPTSVMIAKEQDIEKTEPKRGRTAKSITLPEPLLHALTTLKKPRNNFDPNGFVFQSRNGKALSPNKLRVLRLKPIGETLGMPWITWRIIRRAHESSLAELRTRLAGELVMTTKHRSHGIGGPVRGV